MPTRSEDHVADKFLGSVLGGAIGDAIAFPYLYYSRAFLSSMSAPLTEEFAEQHSGRYPTGQYSDDTQVVLALLEAIVEAAGNATDLDVPIALRHLLPLWRDQVLVERDASCAEAMQRILGSGDPTRPHPLESGRAEASPVGRAVAVALWYHARPDAMHEQLEAMVRLTHTDRRTLACAAAVAGAIEYNLTTSDLILGDFLDAVAGGAERFDARVAEAILDFPRSLSMTEYRCQRHFEEVYEDQRYPASDEGLSVYTVPTVLFALHAFLKSPHDYEATVDRCVRLGGQMDTATFLAGAISGAHLGYEALPEGLRDGLHGSTELRQTTGRVHELWRTRNPTPLAQDSENRN